MDTKHRKMPSSRLGMSPVIAFVLIITLVASIGAFVTVWYKGATKKQIGASLEPFEGGAECEQVKYEIVFNYDECKVDIYNLGVYKIDEVKADFYYADGDHKTTTEELGILPKWGQPIMLGEYDGFEKAKFTPLIIRGGKKISCTKEREHVPEQTFNC